MNVGTVTAMPSPNLSGRDQDAWLFPFWTRKEAEQYVCGQQRGSFVVRQSSSGEGHVLCVSYGGGKLKHFLVSSSVVPQAAHASPRPTSKGRRRSDGDLHHQLSPASHHPADSVQNVYHLDHSNHTFASLFTLIDFYRSGKGIADLQLVLITVPFDPEFIAAAEERHSRQRADRAARSETSRHHGSHRSSKRSSHKGTTSHNSTHDQPLIATDGSNHVYMQQQRSGARDHDSAPRQNSRFIRGGSSLNSSFISSISTTSARSQYHHHHHHHTKQRKHKKHASSSFHGKLKEQPLQPLLRQPSHRSDGDPRHVTGPPSAYYSASDANPFPVPAATFLAWARAGPPVHLAQPHQPLDVDQPVPTIATPITAHKPLQPIARDDTRENEQTGRPEKQQVSQSNGTGQRRQRSLPNGLGGPHAPSDLHKMTSTAAPVLQSRRSFPTITIDEAPLSRVEPSQSLPDTRQNAERPGTAPTRAPPPAFASPDGISAKEAVFLMTGQPLEEEPVELPQNVRAVSPSQEDVTQEHTATTNAPNESVEAQNKSSRSRFDFDYYGDDDADNSAAIILGDEESLLRSEHNQTQNSSIDRALFARRVAMLEQDFDYDTEELSVIGGDQPPQENMNTIARDPASGLRQSRARRHMQLGVAEERGKKETLPQEKSRAEESVTPQPKGTVRSSALDRGAVSFSSSSSSSSSSSATDDSSGEDDDDEEEDIVEAAKRRQAAQVHMQKKRDGLNERVKEGPSLLDTRAHANFSSSSPRQQAHHRESELVRFHIPSPPLQQQQQHHHHRQHQLSSAARGSDEQVTSLLRGADFAALVHLDEISLQTPIASPVHLLSDSEDDVGRAMNGGPTEVAVSNQGGDHTATRYTHHPRKRGQSNIVCL